MTLEKNSFWLRGWARFCDYCLLFLVLGAISLFLPLFYDPFFYMGVALTIPIIWVPLEALFLNRWGASCGKFLFGIRVRDASGKNLPYFSALRRAAFIPKRPGVVKFKPLSVKRKILSMLVTLACFGAGVFGNLLTPLATGINPGITQAEGWVKFESDKADFEVNFPQPPTQESKQLILPTTGKVLEYEEISSQEEENLHYSVTHMNIPRKWKLAGDATLLKLSLESIVKHSPKTELISKEFIVVPQGHRALEYHLKEEGNDVRGRLIIVGNTMYKLTITSPVKNHVIEEAETTPFLDSFVTS